LHRSRLCDDGSDTAAGRACSSVLPAAGSRSESSHCRASLLDLRMASASNCRSPEPIGQQPVELAASSDKESSRFPPIGRKTKRNSSGKWELLRSSVHRKRVPHLSNLRGIISSRRNSHQRFGDMNSPSERAAKAVSSIFIGKCTVLIWSSLREKPYRHGELRRLGCLSQPIRTRALRNLESAGCITRSVTGSKSLAVACSLTLVVKKSM